MSQSIPNYFRALPVRKTLPKALPAPTSTESLPTQILTAATDCFYLLFRLTLRLSNIVGAEEIQGRSSGVAVIRPVNLLQTSTSIQRKNKPSARWEATSEFEADGRERRLSGRPVTAKQLRDAARCLFQQRMSVRQLMRIPDREPMPNRLLADLSSGGT